MSISRACFAIEAWLGASRFIALNIPRPLAALFWSNASWALGSEFGYLPKAVAAKRNLLKSGIARITGALGDRVERCLRQCRRAHPKAIEAKTIKNERSLGKRPAADINLTGDGARRA